MWEVCFFLWHVPGRDMCAGSRFKRHAFYMSRSSLCISRPTPFHKPARAATHEVRCIS